MYSSSPSSPPRKVQENAPTAAAPPTPAPAEPPRKVALIIAAHPDDADFGAGGTTATWTRQGWEFHYLVVTNGAKGSHDREMSRARLIAMREEEQRNAAAAVGALYCTFLGAEDGELEYTRDALGGIVRTIRRLRPLAVFTHAMQELHRRPFRAVEGEDAEFVGFVNHRDHRITGTLAIDAIYPTARDHLNFPEHIDQEGLETHKVREIYVWGANSPNFTVDISGAIDAKAEAIRRHLSQFGADRDAFLTQLKDRWRDDDGHYYERFDKLVLPR